MLRYFKVWLSIGWLLIIMMCYVSLTSAPPEFHIEFKYIDKVGHFFAYFILTAWFAQLYKSHRARLYFVLFFITMGIILEILQGLGGVRLFEYYDMLANSFGVAIAWMITKKHFNNLLLSFETQLRR